MCTESLRADVHLNRRYAESRNGVRVPKANTSSEKNRLVSRELFDNLLDVGVFEVGGRHDYG